MELVLENRKSSLNGATRVRRSHKVKVGSRGGHVAARSTAC